MLGLNTLRQICVEKEREKEREKVLSAILGHDSAKTYAMMNLNKRMMSSEERKKELKELNEITDILFEIVNN